MKINKKILNNINLFEKIINYEFKNNTFINIRFSRTGKD